MDFRAPEPIVAALRAAKSGAASGLETTLRNSAHCLEIPRKPAAICEVCMLRRTPQRLAGTSRISNLTTLDASRLPIETHASSLGPRKGPRRRPYEGSSEARPEPSCGLPGGFPGLLDLLRPFLEAVLQPPSGSGPVGWAAGCGVWRTRQRDLSYGVQAFRVFRVPGCLRRGSVHSETMPSTELEGFALLGDSCLSSGSLLGQSGHLV